jgi:hypothetical protein
MVYPVSLVPVLVLIDVEPDGFFIERTKNVPWSGFERATQVMAGVRQALSHATGRDAHFTWLVRADEQIAETYGSAGWAFERYRSDSRRCSGARRSRPARARLPVAG